MAALDVTQEAKNKIIVQALVIPSGRGKEKMPHSVDISGNLAKFLTDQKRKIPKAHLKSVCKKKILTAGTPVDPSQCRYVANTPFGCWCAKITPMKQTLDTIVANSKGGARGDNCPGFEGSGNFGVTESDPTSESR